MSAIDTGRDKYQQFTTDRIVGDGNIFEKMSRLKLKNWTSSGKNVTISVNKQSFELKENRSLFARLALAVCAKPDLDMAESIGTYEFSCVCRALFANDGTMLPSTAKSQLMNIIKSLAKESSDIAYNQFLHQQSCPAIMDGMVFVQYSSSSSAVTTCSDIADQYISIISRITENYRTVHVVFDNYTVRQSVKQSTREKRTKGQLSAEYICTDSTRVPGSVKKFLSHVKTKHSLTIYLAKKLLEHYHDTFKTLTVSTSEGASSNHGDVSCLSSNHEEADTMLILRTPCYNSCS